jgi:hypothetical protein
MAGTTGTAGRGGTTGTGARWHDRQRRHRRHDGLCAADGEAGAGGPDERERGGAVVVRLSERPRVAPLATRVGANTFYGTVNGIDYATAAECGRCIELTRTFTNAIRPR